MRDNENDTPDQNNYATILNKCGEPIFKKYLIAFL